MGLSTVVTGHVGGAPAGQGKGGFDLGDVATLAHIGKTDSERRVLGSNIMSAAQQRRNARAGRRASVELASGSWSFPAVIFPGLFHTHVLLYSVQLNQKTYHYNTVCNV